MTEGSNLNSPPPGRSHGRRARRFDGTEPADLLEHAPLDEGGIFVEDSVASAEAVFEADLAAEAAMESDLAAETADEVYAEPVAAPVRAPLAPRTPPTDPETRARATAPDLPAVAVADARGASAATGASGPQEPSEPRQPSEPSEPRQPSEPSQPSEPAATTEPSEARTRTGQVPIAVLSERRATSAGEYHDSLRRSLLGRPLRDDKWAWILPGIVAALAALLRFWDLGTPHRLVFDETYYVKGGWTMIQSGTDLKWPDEIDGTKINALFEAGQTSTYLQEGDFVVHPPIGKILIGISEQIFGITSSLGWRAMTALVGVLMVLMLARIARRIFRSTILGALTGLWMAIDGLAIVQSRTSLLDQYVAFFALAAFGFLVLDRDWSRARLAERMAGYIRDGNTIPDIGPRLGFRYYRLLAGISLGLCCGSKWSGIYFVAVFGLMTVLWDLNARRVAGVKRYVWSTFWPQGIAAFCAIVPVTFAVYLLSWTGWFLSSLGWGKGEVEKATFTLPEAAPGWLGDLVGWDWMPGILRDFVYYHWQMYNFSVNLSSEHPYMTKPITWLLQLRPTSYYYESYTNGQAGCTVEKCSSAITSLGNPILWWVATLALLVSIFFLIARRDWRAGVPVAGILAGYAPWFLYWDRTIFTFYSVAFEAFLWIGLTYFFVMLIGGEDASPRRRREGIIVLGCFVVLALAVSAFFYPIWTAQVIPYDQWRWRMWLPSWI